MTLEQLVTDLATSQRLRDAGFPQDTALAWFVAKPDGAHETCLWVQMPSSQDDCVAAPTAGELEEWLMTRGKNASLVMSPDFISYWQSARRKPHRVAVVTRVAALATLVLEAVG